MASIALSAIEKVYPGQVRALHPLDLEIEDGEFVVLVGPSGCGKSTLLRIVAGLETPTAGLVEIDGQDVTRVEPGQRDVAMVFQNYALYPHMDVAANMGYGLKNRGMARREIERRVGETAELLGLTGLLARKPKALSGGQRQRVAMGRAIVREPRAFLFDEPLSNLDTKLRVQMRHELRQLQRRLGTTAIYVTHDQIEALTLADRVVVMNEGRIEQVASPRVLFDRPSNRFVADFIGSTAMNQIPLRAEAGVVYLMNQPVDLSGVVSQVGQLNGCTLGIRPEHLRVVGADEADFVATVTAVEPHGSTQLVFLSADGADQEIRVQLDAAVAIREQDLLPVQMVRKAVHLFDAAGDRLN